MNNRVDDAGIPARGIRFEIILASLLLAFGLFALPALIYAAGATILGPYLESAPGDSIATFYRTFFADLAAPSGRAWGIAVGPLLITALFRLAFIGHRHADAASARSDPRDPPARRPAAPSRPAPAPAASRKQSAARNGRRVEPRIGSD